MENRKRDIELVIRENFELLKQIRENKKKFWDALRGVC